MSVCLKSSLHVVHLSVYDAFMEKLKVFSNDITQFIMVIISSLFAVYHLNR